MLQHTHMALIIKKRVEGTAREKMVASTHASKDGANQKKTSIWKTLKLNLFSSSIEAMEQQVLVCSHILLFFSWMGKSILFQSTFKIGSLCERFARCSLVLLFDLLFCVLFVVISVKVFVLWFRGPAHQMEEWNGIPPPPPPHVDANQRFVN